MREIFWVVMLVVCPIWIVALVSHLSGNTTAINALIGIPLGVLVFFGLLWLMEKIA